MKPIIVSEIEIEVVKKKIKNVNLYVLPPDGRVRITAPLKTSDEFIRSFALQKMAWIKKQKQRLMNLPQPPNIEYISGEYHNFFGSEYRLEVRQTGRKGGIEISGGSLIMSAPKGSNPEQRQRVLYEWYRQELKKRIPLLLDKWEPVMGVKCRDWGVKNMKTRWGTCNPRDRRIWVNLQLARRPERCLEYIVVHELVHLLVSNHGQEFIAHMNRYLPDWRIIKAELNRLKM